VKRIRKEDRAGFYITVIFHLAVIIVLLISKIGSVLQEENTFVLDFSKQEAIEKQEKADNMREDIAERLERLLAAAESGDLRVRNVAVDRSSLKDDRGTDAEDLYKDAEKLQKDLDKTFSRKDEDIVAEPEDIRKKEESKDKSESAYKGPSVVSWTLDGRKASHLSIPAYKCYGGGLVTVIITVDNSGKVRSAKVNDAISSADQCLRDYAIRAAQLSRFSQSTTAPASQTGEIVYQFIPQR